MQSLKKLLKIKYKILIFENATTLIIDNERKDI